MLLIVARRSSDRGAGFVKGKSVIIGDYGL